ncbi:MAG: MATE family efflux transporter [Acetobacter sp.]|nr:MATE family efflux transporter [Acetobacter sp.]
MIKDMTTGNALKLILLFSLPILLGNIFQQLYQLADIFIVGRLLGENALAAVGASAPIYFTFLIIAFSFTGGLTAVTAQRFGAGDNDGVRRSVTHSIRASLVLSLGLTILLVSVLKPLMHLLNVPESIFTDSYHFILILSSALILIVAFNLLSGFIRALGDSKTPLYFLIFSTVLNILFNYILIKYAKLGVIGSALGTLCAIAISVICCILYIKKYYPILRLKKEDWRYNPAFMREHLHIAIPMSIQFSILSLSIMVIQAVSNSFGEQVIVGLTISLRVEQLATQPLMAIGLAMATFVAQNYGAGKISRIRSAVRQTSAVSFAISIVMSACVFFFGRQVLGSFLENPDPAAINIGMSYLAISIMFYFFLGMIFIFKNTLQSMGKPFYPVISGFVELGIRSYAAIYLAHKIGYEGIYYASPLAWVGGAIVVFIGYYLNLYRRSESDLKAEYRTLYRNMKK